MSFNDEFPFGKIGESKIANWLRYGRGYCILPVYEIAKGQYKGPQLFTPEGELIAPDMLCFRKNKVIWIEAKHKTVFSWHRRTQRWVTGVDVHHYENYLKASVCSEWPVWLMFYHPNGDSREHDGRSPTGLFGGALRELRDKENHRFPDDATWDVSRNYGKGGMVYWARESLVLLATVEEVERYAGGRPSYSQRPQAEKPEWVY